MFDSKDQLIWTTPVSLPKNDADLIECFVSKTTQYGHVALRFGYCDDINTTFQTDLNDYYANKTDSIGLEKYCQMLGKNGLELNDIKSQMVILHRDHNYYRAKIEEIWPYSMFKILLIDEGFHYVAHRDDLMMNDNEEFLNYRYQGRVYCVELSDIETGNYQKHKHLIQYALNKTILRFEKFLFEFVTGYSDGDNMPKIRLYGMDNDNGDVVDVKHSVKDILDKLLKDPFYDIDQAVFKPANGQHSQPVHLKQNVQISTTKSKLLHSTPNKSPLKRTTNSELTFPKLFLDDNWELIKMKVKFAISPGKFYLKLQPENRDYDYEELKVKILQHFTSGQAKQADQVKIGNLYGVNRGNDRWARVLVLEKDKSSSFNCFLIDKGVEDCFLGSKLFELSDELKQYHPLTVCASLDYIKPKGSNKDDWNDEEVNEIFLMEVFNKMADVMISKFDQERAIIHCILLIDDKNIGDHLVSEGHVLEESI